MSKIFFEDLLPQYRTTRKMVHQKIEELKMQVEKIKWAHVGDIELKMTPKDSKLLVEYEEKLTIFREELSDLNFAITWMNTGNKPGPSRGIDRRSAHEREVPFEPYWVQRRQDNKIADAYEANAFETEGLEKRSQEQKISLVNTMTDSLTERQTEILALTGNGYSHEDIAALLGVHIGTVSRTIARAKEKINEEGWFMP